MIKLKTLIPEITLKHSPYTIYCDMDGVLCDFDKQFIAITNTPPDEYEQINGKEQFWSIIDDKGVEYWSTMEWIPGSNALWNIIKLYNVKILSAPPKINPTFAKQGKQIWVNKHLGSNIEIIFAAAEKKKEYADAHSILIDDMDKNITGWKSAGGVGILFKTPQQAISELQKLNIT